MDVLQGQEEGVLSEKFTVAKREGRSSITGMCSVNLKFCIHLNLDYFLWHRSQSLFKTFFFFFLDIHTFPMLFSHFHKEWIEKFKFWATRVVPSDSE